MSAAARGSERGMTGRWTTWLTGWRGGVLAALGPLLLYLRTMAPTVYGLDSAELSAGAYTLGIVHAPGAPLYLLVGHLFTWLPIGDVGFRLNLLSAVTSALTAAGLYAIVGRLTRDPVIALGTAWLVASTYYVWLGGIAAELYGPQGCVLVALLLLALGWRRDGRPRQLLAFAVLFGLGLGIHLSLILLAPGFAWLIVRRGEIRRRPGLLAIAALLALVAAAAMYLYLPLRQRALPPIDYVRDYWGVDLATWDGFWWMVSGQMFRARLFAVPLRDVLAELVLYCSRLWSNFMGLGFLLGVVGLADELRQRPGIAVGLVLMFVAHVGFFVTYGVIDKELMFLPSFLIWGIWIGAGAALVHDAVARWTNGRWSIVVPSVVFLMAAGNVVVNVRYLDLSNDWSARQRGEGILQTLQPDAVYFGDWGDVPILEYLQVVEGQRPDVATVNLVFVDEPNRRRLVYDHAAAGRPVYTSAPAALEDGSVRFDYFSECDCFQLRDSIDRCALAR